MKLVIIDGQSGRMGALLAERIKAAKLPCEVLAIGTNAIATAAMMKAGAGQGATGENPVLVACRTADVIAGTFKGVQGIARTFTPIEMYNLRLKGKTALAFTLPRDYNTGILVVEGNLRVNGNEMAPADNFILFRNDGEKITLETEESTTALVLSGQPIKEPIVAYGPFLMNTKEEIMDAFHDLNSGKFGKLEDE